MKFLFKLLVATIFIMSFSDAQANPAKSEIKYGKRIGIVSLFPGKSGMFYNDRGFSITETPPTSLFPTKEVKFIDVNDKITRSLAEYLGSKFKKEHKFIPLPSLSPEKNLKGYLVEGPWGVDTNNIVVNGLKKFQQDLDNIIAIVPVTYYVPTLKGEGSGMNLIVSNNNLSFSASYAVLIFSKKGNSYIKSYGSIKQVYIQSQKHTQKQHNIKKYDQQHINIYYSLFEKGFLPHITKQVEQLLEKSDPIFPTPKKPLHYYLPH